MDNFLYINACRDTIAGEITAIQTTIQVSSPGRFPTSIPLGQVLVLTLHPDGLPSTQEIVHCTAISGSTLTVVRGAQGTTAALWPAGTVIGAYLTAEMLSQIANDVRGHAGSGGSAHALATTVAAGFMSAASVTKLDGIQAGATNYAHPATHAPSVIAQDSSNRFVTDAEKADWVAAKNHADSAHAPSNAQKNSDITKGEIVAKLTGNADEHSHAVFSGLLENVDEKIQALGNISGSRSINLALGNVITATLTGTATISFTGWTSGKSRTFMLKLTNGGAYAITWSNTLKWPGGIVPALTASGRDILVFSTTDAGTTLDVNILPDSK